MSASVFAAGFDPARVPWRLSALGPEFCLLEGRAAGHALLTRLGESKHSVALLGPWIPDFTLPEVVRRIRGNPGTRVRSIMALLPDAEARLPGANTVLPLSTDTATLEKWVTKLRAVPTRVRFAARVRGYTTTGRRPFIGMTQNISLGGMRVLTPDPVTVGLELDLWIELPSAQPVPVLGRVIRTDPGLGSEQRGCGIELVYTPPASEDAIVKIVTGDRPPRAAESTIKRGEWTYEVFGPLRRGDKWEAEVWRTHERDPRGERFFAVAGASSRDAVREARELLLAWAVVRGGSGAPVPEPEGH